MTSEPLFPCPSTRIYLFTKVTKSCAWYFKDCGAGVTMRNRGFYLDTRIGCKIRRLETRDMRGTMCFHRSASVPARTRTLRTCSLRVPKLRRRQCPVPMIRHRYPFSCVYLPRDSNFTRMLKASTVSEDQCNNKKKITEVSRSYINMYTHTYCHVCLIPLIFELACSTVHFPLPGVDTLCRMSKRIVS